MIPTKLRLCPNGAQAAALFGGWLLDEAESPWSLSKGFRARTAPRWASASVAQETMRESPVTPEGKDLWMK